MINRVVLVGRLTRDPDLRYTPQGTAVCNFTIATNRPFKNAQGEQEADFINCVVWRAPAENLANYMKKGSQIGVDGRLQSRAYEGDDNKMVFVTEVVADSVQFLETKRSQSNGGGQSSSGGTNTSGGQQSNQSAGDSPYNHMPNDNQDKGGPLDISDDDLPF